MNTVDWLSIVCGTALISLGIGIFIGAELTFRFWRHLRDKHRL